MNLSETSKKQGIVLTGVYKNYLPVASVGIVHSFLETKEPSPWPLADSVLSNPFSYLIPVALCFLFYWFSNEQPEGTKSIFLVFTPFWLVSTISCVVLSILVINEIISAVLLWSVFFILLIVPLIIAIKTDLSDIVLK